MLKRGLGKGLGAMIPTNTSEESVTELDINKVEPNPQQPRKAFDNAALEELCESIRQYGVLQPLIVVKRGSFFMIVAGERRWRAARMAKLARVPVIVKDYSDQEVLQIALIENLQRADLNLLEEAQGFKSLAHEFNLRQEDIATLVNKSRSYISNSLRILELDDRVQGFVADKKMSMGHLKLLMPLKSGDSQFEMAEAILEEGLSVRDTEVLIREFTTEEKRMQVLNLMKEQADQNAAEQQAAPPRRNTQFFAIERELNTLLGTPVRIVSGKKRGKIEIEYYSNDDLDRLITLFRLKQ